MLLSCATASESSTSVGVKLSFVFCWFISRAEFHGVRGFHFKHDLIGQEDCRGKDGEVVDLVISLSPVESQNSRGAGRLCQCQELIQFPVEQPVSCGGVQSCTAFDRQSTVAMLGCDDVETSVGQLGDVESCYSQVADELATLPAIATLLRGLHLKPQKFE